jgi:hypothetical protein
MTLAMIDQMSAAAEAMSACADRHDYAGWQAAHRTFHGILTIGPNRRISDFLQQLNDHDDRYRRIYAGSASLAWGAGGREHNKILDCVRRFDAGAVANAIARHIARAATIRSWSAKHLNSPCFARILLAIEDQRINLSVNLRRRHVLLLCLAARYGHCHEGGAYSKVKHACALTSISPSACTSSRSNPATFWISI